MKVFHDSEVLEELILLAGYIADENEETAQHFLDACDATFRFLAHNRFIGSIRKFHQYELSEVRMWHVKGFEKYLIFYRPIEDGVRILHVLHSARDYNRLFEDE